MSTNQQTRVTSINSAHATAASTKAAAVSTAIATVNQSGVDVAYKQGFPTGNATYVAAVATANAAKLASIAAAEVAKQGAIAVAKDLLRSQNEIPF